MPQQHSRFFKPGFRPTRLLLPVLLLAGSLCHAEVLYKWREADGTLTFSPEPPTDSRINYEKVVSGQGSGGEKAVSAGNASTNGFGSLPEGLTLDPVNAPAANTTIKRPLADPILTRSTQKSTHCQELKKRVVSLERLLQTDISNETMDNAVVQMARYQTSFNQACGRTRLR